MTKIWNSEVNTGEMVYKLKDSLKSALTTYHQDIIQHIRDKCVRKETRAMQGVLQKFFQACVDSSINERSVHFIWSTGIEFDKFYNMFETLLLKDTSSFLKSALEVGYQAKNLKAVYSAFEEYSKVI